MKKVLLALLVLGMSATSQASIVLDLGRHGTETIKLTGMEITNGNLILSTAKGTYTMDTSTLRTAGVSALEMVTLLNKYNDSKSTLKISGVSYLQYNTQFVGSLSLNF